MSEISDLLQALQALQLDRFAGLPDALVAKFDQTDDSPVRIAVVGPQSNLVLNCLVRDVLFHETALPIHLRWPAKTPISLQFGEIVEPLEDAREWKPLQRATYLKKFRTRIDSWSAEVQAKKGLIVQITYPFTNPFSPTAVEFQNFRDGANIILDTWITRRTSDGSDQLAISSTLGKFEGLQPRVALASAVARMNSPELKFFDMMVARIITPAVRRATATRASSPSLAREATKAVKELRGTADAAEKLATAIQKALGHLETVSNTQLKRVPSNATSPRKKDIQMKLTEKAPPHLVVAHTLNAIPNGSEIPPKTIEQRTETPYFANEDPEPAWNPSHPSWNPREPEWKPPNETWKPKLSEWVPSKGTEWKPNVPSPATGYEKEQWEPKAPTWRPADSSWKPQPPEWQEAAEA
eukprot:TRINITY_DN29647_c0_g1_i1.p1 TRINITY_DN29647_c0_g1~~TRINITY_DN29647_c0_g1_i1.p1  ORF type:complete len:411 (-),score=55.43 TRINITY_DN29647_c0_g1_i1:186-1418(-)